MRMKLICNKDLFLDPHPPIFKITNHKSTNNKKFQMERSVIVGGRVSSAFFFQEFIFNLIGRFPFQIHPPYRNSIQSLPRLRLIFIILNWIYFLLTSIILLLILILTSLGFGKYYLKWNFLMKSSYEDKEMKAFTLNLIPFVLFYGCLIHGTIGSISFLLNRKYIIQYFKKWNEIVDILHIKFSLSSLQKFLIISNFIIFGFCMLLTIFFVNNFVPITRGFSNLLMMLLLRPFYGTNVDLVNTEMSFVNGIGLMITFYVIYASRSLVLFFTFICRLLRICFDSWNRRLKSVLTIVDVKRNNNNIVREQQHQTNNERLTCEKLFRDHCILIRTMRRTDALFAAVLQSYYLTQILNMCFELYYLARTGYWRNEDIPAAFVLVFQTFAIFFTVSLEGAYVNDVAMEGFHILRSRGIQIGDSLEKKYLIQNLLINYSHNLTLTGGKFFQLDRPFILKVLGAVFTYFVIILQFAPQIGDATNIENENSSITPAHSLIT